MKLTLSIIALLVVSINASTKKIPIAPLCFAGGVTMYGNAYFNHVDTMISHSSKHSNKC